MVHCIIICVGQHYSIVSQWPSKIAHRPPRGPLSSKLISLLFHCFFSVQNEYTGDSQLVNSVYLDNSSLEVYHGRLDERPTALTVRITWQGPQEPSEVSIERKSQKQTTKGYEEMQDRMTLPENVVVGYLEGEVGVEVAKEFWQGTVRF